ncbi:MAG: hypothetical protein ACYS47_20985 [Planctomycetota bacterium]|jgi:DNA-directed RNA polymerase subunit RPC12/RpoP
MAGTTRRRFQPSKKDSLLGKIAVERKFLTRKQLHDCFRSQEKSNTPGRGRSKSLGSVLVDKKIITRKQLSTIREERDRRLGVLLDLQKVKKTDYLFGQLLVKYSKATQIQINKCLAIQEEYARENKPAPRLGELLAEHGFIDSDTIGEILKLQNKDVFVCSKCGKQYNVVGVEEGKTYACRACSGRLVPKATLDAIKVDETHFGVDLDEFKTKGKET